MFNFSCTCLKFWLVFQNDQLLRLGLMHSYQLYLLSVVKQRLCKKDLEHIWFDFFCKKLILQSTSTRSAKPSNDGFYTQFGWELSGWHGHMINWLRLRETRTATHRIGEGNYENDVVARNRKQVDRKVYKKTMQMRAAAKLVAASCREV